ncbi:hypothetical protein HYDPIDRAFT_104306, partial [Hydnomerulius pinastri MD-312]
MAQNEPVVKGLTYMSIVCAIGSLGTSLFLTRQFGGLGREDGIAALLPTEDRGTYVLLFGLPYGLLMWTSVLAFFLASFCTVVFQQASILQRELLGTGFGLVA